MNLTIQQVRTMLLWLAANLVNGVAAQPQVHSVPGADRPVMLKKVTLYCNDRGELTSPEKSTFSREALLDFNDIQLTGMYKDFSKENKLIGDGFYDQGLKRGLYTEYFENGSVRSTIENDDNGFIIWELTNERKEFEIARGSGKFAIPYRDFTDGPSTTTLNPGGGILTGEFQDGKRVGKWTYTNASGKKTDEEIYEKGSLVKRIVFSESGALKGETNFRKSIVVSRSSLPVEAFHVDPKTYTHLNQFFEQNVQGYPVIMNRRMTYPGGLKKLLVLIASNLQVQATGHTYPARLKVNKHGRLKIRLPPYIDESLENEFMRVIKPYEHKLLPAIKNGKPYWSSIRIPITNSSDWIDFLHTASTEQVIADLARQWYNGRGPWEYPEEMLDQE